MKHAAMALALYRAAAAMEALADWMPATVAGILRPHSQALTRVADWHHQQAEKAI